MPFSTTFRRAARALAPAVFLLVLAGTAFAVPGQLYVTSDASNKVRRFNGASGAFNNVFCLSAAATGQMAIHFGATNGRVLIGHNAFGVEEWDVASGTYIKTYNAAGGWQWAGLYAPTGEVYIGDMLTNDVRAYNAVTGAFVRVVCAVNMPADMDFGPDGNLYICSWGSMSVEIVDGVTGSPVSSIALPVGALPNDVAFHPITNDIHVTAMNTNMGYRYDYVTHMMNGNFVGTSWARPHGLVFSPVTGNLLALDGVTAQVHEFDPNTLLEISPAFLAPAPGDKIVDLAFEPAGAPTPARTTTWGRIKRLNR